MAIGEIRTDIHEVIERVESSKEFQEFNTKNPHHYLVHAFSTAAGAHTPVELGYYGKETDRITVFKSEPITMMPPEEVFKEKGVLQPLDLGALRIGLQEALEKSEKYRHDGYPKHTTMKTICILQQSDRPVWNMTLVTNTLNMINMKIDGTTGMMLSREMQNIMDLAK